MGTLTGAPAGPGEPGVPDSPRGPWAPSGPRAPVGPASPWGERSGVRRGTAPQFPPPVLPTSLCSPLTFEPGAPGKPGAPAGPTGPWGNRRVWGGCPGWGGSRRTPTGFSRKLRCGVKAALYLQGVQQGQGDRHCHEHPGGRRQSWGGSQHPDPPPHAALCHRATVTLTAAPEGPGRPRSPGSPRGPCGGGGGTVLGWAQRRGYGVRPHILCLSFPYAHPPHSPWGRGSRSHPVNQIHPVWEKGSREDEPQVGVHIPTPWRRSPPTHLGSRSPRLSFGTIQTGVALVGGEGREAETTL